MSKLVWGPLTGGEVAGYLSAPGQTRIATISLSGRMRDPLPYILRTELPGWRAARPHETLEEAQASAEGCLAAFVDLVGQAEA